MPQQPSVLMISHPRTMRQLTEQVCGQAGAKIVPATSGPAANAIAAEKGLHNFALSGIDTIEPGTETPSQPHMARHLLPEWTAASPLLPVVLVSPGAHKHALLQSRADIVCVVTPPLSRHIGRPAIESGLPIPIYWASGFSALFSNKGTTNVNDHYGPNHHRLSRRDTAVQDGVAS